VVWDCLRAEDAIATMAPRVLVIKGGRITVESRHVVVERWRPA
jgi:hypothetical protein